MGEILSRFERRGIVIEHLQMVQITEEQAPGPTMPIIKTNPFPELLRAVTRDRWFRHSPGPPSSECS